MRLVGRAVPEIDGDVLEGALRPGEMLLACWEILAEARDPRASHALQAGLDYLDDFAARIDDPELRTGFLSNIPAHATLAAARPTDPV